jgi:SAM-dependent methyltransferase
MSQAYHGFEAEWHDLFWEEEDAPSELPFLEEFLSAHGGKFLYVGSGSGRLLGPLTTSRHDIEGLEISSEMIALSQKRWPGIKVREGRWEEAKGRWDAVLIPGFTFQLLASPAQQFAKMAEVVKPGGGAYVSLFFPWAEMSGELPEGHWYADREMELADGNRAELRTRHFIDHQRSELRREHRYRLKSARGKLLKEEKTKQTIRVFADGELEKMIRGAGWEIVKEIQNFGEAEEVVYVITLFLKRLS